MSIITNIVASQALHGQGVKFTINTDVQETLDSLSIGQVVTIDQSGKTGTIYSIDSFGNSFKVVPIQPNTRFDGTQDGVLSVDDTITI